jgi:Rieske Fe-S protein
VVVASHYPILDRSLFFACLEPARSYCIAARVRDELPRGMSISAGGTTRSVRSYGDTLIVGGEGHSVGARSSTPERFAKLEEFAREHWDVVDVTHRWSAQDPTSWDLMPVVGHYHPRTSRLFVASGFHKWGLSCAGFAGRIVADLIAGRTNPWADAMDPNRVGARGLPKVAQLGTKFMVDFVGDRVAPSLRSSVEDLPRGEARIVRSGVGRTGVYRNDAGALSAVSVRCTHLGCLVRWNKAERSWDCPCHGSRFDVDGSVLEGPATRPLERKEI